MAFKVYNPKPLCAEAEQMLAEAGVEIVKSSGPSKEDLLKDTADVDAAVIWLSPNRFDKEVIDNAKNLKLISRFGVGMEIVDVEYAQEKGIMVCNTPTSNGNAVAEHTIYLIMALAKNSKFVNQQIEAGEWNTIKKTSAVELGKSTLGVIGLGNIGKNVCRKALGLGMKVIGYAPRPKDIPEGVTVTSDLNYLLANSDFVSMHTPETPQTIGMMGYEQFKQMKPTAFFINDSRGKVVVQSDLERALSEGLIKGAGLDVFIEEPLPMDSPLRGNVNVIITPHYAGFTNGAVINTGLDVAQSILDVMNGGRPKYEIKKK